MKKLILVMFLMLVLVFPACNTAAKAPLKVGVIPMMTVLPLYVADREDLFQKQGVDVEIVPFRSVLDRDAALAAGQLDGIIEDIFSAPLLNKEQPTVKVVAVSPVEGPIFYIIASPKSKARAMADLKGSEIAASLKTITEYAVDRLAAAGGIGSSDVSKVSIPSMPLRLEMLNEGKVEAAVLSRPLADVALVRGGKLMADDGRVPLSTSSIMFSVASLKARSGDVKKFVAAWSKAVDRIDAEPQVYRSLLIEVGSVPAEVAEKIDVPRFVKPRMPTADELEPKVDWLLEKGILGKKVFYQEIVASGFLP